VEIHQLKTLVAVAHEGSITRASEHLYISQPAVSAHIKAIEETLGLTLFERTSRGMSLTSDGQQILVKAEQILSAHRELLEEATHIKGRLTGKVRLGTACHACTEVVGHLLTTLSERYPEVEVVLQHGNSFDILNGIRNGALDAGFYNEASKSDADLTTMEISRFGIYLAAPPGLVATKQPLDWPALAELPWICPTSSTCCGQAAEHLFMEHQIRPKRIISIDREHVTRTLITGGVGIGLLHADTAREAESCGDVELIHEIEKPIRVLFAHLANRSQDPLLSAVCSILHAEPPD